MNPLFDQLAAQAGRDNDVAVAAQVRGDQASILARYGTRVALAGTGGTPVMSPAFGKAA
ncbi:MAG: hypothetical protein ABIO35_08230 [Nitrobacter sp.]